jgi:NDP-sugar pyrophosphorylase family protein
VLMAGGRGLRLGSYTVNTPKPMLQLGDKPLLETTVESFAEQGFQTIWISVNYLADVIRRHFGDGERWGISIRYIEEGQPLGTAGALRQIGESQTESFIVMNGDILTKLNFRNLIDEHRRQGFDATICTRMHDITVPYGVLNLNGNAVAGMTEKPKIRYPVNAGIYVLPPAVPQLIPENQPFGMDQLIQDMLNAGLRIGAHLLSDYWADIGDVNDLERASRDFEKIFSSPEFEKQEA